MTRRAKPECWNEKPANSEREGRAGEDADSLSGLPADTGHEKAHPNNAVQHLDASQGDADAKDACSEFHRE